MSSVMLSFLGIKVDGGMVQNDLLCQILADIAGNSVIRPQMTETTALGAAMVAGHYLGVWPITEKTVQRNEIVNEKPHSNGIVSSLFNSLMDPNSTDKPTKKVMRRESVLQNLGAQNFTVFNPQVVDSIR